MNEVNIVADCGHFPGVRKMFYCFKDAIDSMTYPRHVNQWRIDDIKLKDGRKWGRINFLANSGSFDEPVSNSNHGDSYNISGSGTILSTNELSTTLLQAISRKEAVLIVEDEKGNMRIVGNEEKGVRLKVSQASAQVGANLFGYIFSFSFMQDGPAYWIYGDMEETDEGGNLEPIKVAKLNYLYEFNVYHYCGLFDTGENTNGKITRIEVLPDATTDVKTATGDWADRYTLIYT